MHSDRSRTAVTSKIEHIVIIGTRNTYKEWGKDGE